MAKKSKSMKGSDGQRKLATGAGRSKQKSGGESQKDACSARFRRPDGIGEAT
jgi:hypothetical protein